MNKNKKKETVDLIVPTNAPRQADNKFADKGGGDTHGLKEAWASMTKKKTVDVDVMQENFDKCIKQVNKIVSHLKNDTVLGWEAASLSVGLAISANGSVGIATVGTEATIEITFAPKKKTNNSASNT